MTNKIKAHADGLRDGFLWGSERETNLAREIQQYQKDGSREAFWSEQNVHLPVEHKSNDEAYQMGFREGAENFVQSDLNRTRESCAL